MDPKTLHIAFERMLANVQWDKHGENEYVVVGDGPNLRISTLQKLITETFTSKHLWISLSRKVGYPIPINEAADHASRLIAPNVTVTISDQSVSHFLQIHPIGVARTGKSPALPPFGLDGPK